MAGLADLAPASMPAFADDGADAYVTEGTSWVFPLITDLVDANGDPLDWDGVTGACVVWDFVTRLEVVEIDVDLGTPGEIALSADEALTDGLALGQKIRRCCWGLRLSDAETKVQFWAAANSVFYIMTED